MFRKADCHDEITHFCQGSYYNNRLFHTFLNEHSSICLVSEADGNAYASLVFFGGREGKTIPI